MCPLQADMHPKEEEGKDPACLFLGPVRHFCFQTHLNNKTIYSFSFGGGRGMNEGTLRDEESHSLRGYSRWKCEIGEKISPLSQVCHLDCFWFSELASVATP